MSKRPRKTRRPATAAADAAPSPDLLNLLEQRMEEQAREIDRPAATPPTADARPPAEIILPFDRANESVPADVMAMHALLPSSAAYAKLVTGANFPATSPYGRWITRTAAKYLDEFVRQMNPRDPVEHGLVMQLAMTNARINWLNEHLPAQSTLAKLTTFNGAVDRAMASYRRSMLALRTYRGAAAPPTINITENNGNDAGQQIVGAAHPSSFGEKNNHGTRVQTEPRRAQEPSEVDPQEQALAPLHRPTDTGGQRTEPVESVRSRRKVGARRRVEPCRCVKGNNNE